MLANYTTGHAGGSGKGLFSLKNGCCQQLHPFVSLHALFGTYFFDVDKLADIHVIISVLDIRPYSLNYLAHHRHNNVPPGQRQGLVVQKLLKQCHHVVVISRSVRGETKRFIVRRIQSSTLMSYFRSRFFLTSILQNSSERTAA